MKAPQPIPINIDWLAFSVLLPLDDTERHEGIKLYTPEGYTLRHFTGTNIYQNRAILFNEFGDKTLTLLYNPHSKIIAPNSMYVEVANRELYTDLKPILNLVGDVHDFTFQSMSRIDLCGDFAPTDKQLAVIKALQAGDIYAQGKREGSMFHTYQRSNGTEGKQERTPKCMSWGSMNSDVKFKLYNKTKEITETDTQGRTFCNKPYIPAMWRENGLPTNTDIWRLEVSITGASSYAYRGEKIDWNITDPTNFTPLYWDMVANRFTLRHNQGHKYTKNDQLAAFLPIPPPPHYRIRKLEPHAEQYHTDHAVTLRSLMKELDRPEIQSCPTLATSLLNTLEDVITHAHLEGYFQRAVGSSFGSWRREFSANFLESK